MKIVKRIIAYMKRLGWVRPLLLVCGVGLLFYSSRYIPPLILITGRVIADQGPAAALVYVAVSAAGIVLLPLSSLPLVPIAAAAWGVAVGGILSIFGWWIGSLAAFLIGRHLGRPFLIRLFTEERLAGWETRLPRHATFITVVLLRLVLPVEIPSYLLGLSRAVGFWTYAIASLIGMSPFAFAILAMGGAVAAGEWVLLSLLGLASTLIFYLLFLVYRRYRD